MNQVKFTVNGEHITLLGNEVSPSTSLNDYIRYHLGLFGTKAMCHEGGCGVCIVSVTRVHPGTKEKHTIAVNSCLVHVLSCHEWDITTVEGVGNRRDGYSPIQTRLAAFNGTQCGYCTPGWIMNMHSLCESDKNNLTTMQIERSFGGNLCRCTGYRPIMDAFKTFATDVDSTDIRDLEDLHEMKCVKRCNKKSKEEDWCLIENHKETLLDLPMDSGRWYKAYTVSDVFKIIKQEGTDSYRLVAGNTGKGVYVTEDKPNIYIDISSISSLQDQFVDENLVLGAGLSLHDAMKIFHTQMKNEDFAYLGQFYQHLELVANVPVKNIGSIGGNLALKHAHPEFPSDLFLILETVNAMITLVNMKNETTEMNLMTFLQTDLKDKLILNVKIPPLSNAHVIRTYKIMPRAQNVHAIVNAGFHFALSPTNTIRSSNILFGSINANFVHAKNVENLLNGLPIYSDETLRKVLVMLQESLQPDESPPDPQPFCRKAIALGLIYRALLSLSPNVNPRYVSGGTGLLPTVSRGTQSYDTDKTVWPLNQPLPKLEALAQCAGEVAYAADVESGVRGVHVAFVLSNVCKAEILGFDASQALKLQGVVGFFTAEDIPGTNNFAPNDVTLMTEKEEILASTHVLYYGQPVAVVAAVSRKLALKAAKLVKVTYKKDESKPLLSIQDVLATPDKEKRMRLEGSINASERGSDVYHTIKGTYSTPEQYHFTMETQSCVVTPWGDGGSGGVGAVRGGGGVGGVRVRSATQWMDLIQVAVAQTLNIPNNSVEVEVGRLGGGYGGKASRSSLVACACALVAYKLNRRASLVMSLADNMHAIGKRQACYVQYELGVNREGVIQYVDMTYYSECGISFSTDASFILSTLVEYYDVARWTVAGYSVLTDKAKATWCRAPGTTEATAIAEHLIQRISYITQKDPQEIRQVNMGEKNADLIDMVESFKKDIDFEERQTKIKEFNEKNAWKKKGMQIAVMSFPIEYFGNFPVTVSVYHGDGSVHISHGGIEMGQGINTKVAQVCAYALKIPLHMVKVKAANTFVSPNSMASAGSITSESVAFATMKACQEILKRMEEVKKHMEDPTWLDIVKKTYNAGINLQSNAITSQSDKLPKYTVYGACCSEVTLDVLTGRHELDRVDLLEDTGRSINPDLDVGQIEGSFSMGTGLWTSEHLQYAADGRLLTDRTWWYTPPGAGDAPRDLRVYFRRNNADNIGVLRSKATGEPALVLAVSVPHAIRDAIIEARKEHGYKDTEWLHIDPPFSVENIIKAISPKIESYKLYS